MSATYDSTLPADKDWVRFLTGDTDTTSPEVSDEEITAVLAEQRATGAARKYLAAAWILEGILARFSTAGGGLESKTVSKLSLRWGLSGTSATTIEARIKELKMEGARRLGASPFVVRAV